MREAELAKIHHALWSNPPPRMVRFRGKRLRVTVADDPRRNFRSVTADDLLIITQNLKKSSKHTTWVRGGKNRKLTWVIKNDDYIGCAKSWVEKNQEHTEITQLQKDEILLHDISAA